MALLSAFNPHEFSESTVRTIATGREADLDNILATIRGNLGAKTIQHLIVSAPRGYGKSFMMRHIQIELEHIAREEALPLAVVLMPEEMPHVREPETFLRELTRALTGGAGADAELTWHEDDGAVWDDAVAALDAAIAQKVGPRGLVVALVENFDLMLRRAFPKEVQASRLRATLTAQNGRLMLIAASASGAFDRDYDDRLFQAFKEIVLEPWSVEQCLTFFDRQRIDAGKPPLDAAARARAKAVASFIGGTPRLATLLGDALFDADVLRAADLLQRLVDELTPYYKERIEALPGRAQKLLDALLRGGEPATQSEIARRVKAKSQAAIAGPFNDLVKERVVIGDKAPDSAEVLYRVADRVFAHFYRRRIIDHGRVGCALEALVDLLADYFSPEEKRAKAAEFARLGLIAEARILARLHDADGGEGRAARQWISDNLVGEYIPMRLVPLASDGAADHLRAIADLVAHDAIDEAYDRVAAGLASVESPGDRALLLLARSKLDAYEGIAWGVAAADEAVAIAENIENVQIELTAKLDRAWSLGQLDRFEEAITTARQAADLAHETGDQIREAVALSVLAGSLCARDDHTAAIHALGALAEMADDLEAAKDLALWTTTSTFIAYRVALALAEDPKATDRLNQILRSLAQDLDIDGLRRTCLGHWVEEFASTTIQRIANPETLETWAMAIELHFPGRFSAETARLRDAAQYHKSRRDPAALARLDPDLAQALRTMFPPAETPPPETPRGRKTARHGKR